MDDLPAVDEEEIEQEREEQRRKQQQKEARIALGVDDRVEGGEVASTEEPLLLGGLTLEQVANLSLEEREARWGFSKADLDAAVRVVSILHKTPALYVGDPLLAESRLYTMISRDRSVKRENKKDFKKVQNEERSRRHQLKKYEDHQAVAKTKMRQQRDEALNALMLPPPPDSDDDDTNNDDNKKPQGEENNYNNNGAVALVVQPQGPDGALAETSEDKASPGKLNRVVRCHICHTRYDQLHHFYYSLCPPCADINYQKRLQSCDLVGRVVILTGCRIKIGYAMSLMLLRAGAILIGTTRFVHDCMNRFSEEPDFEVWRDRVHLFALDLRDMWMVTQFCAFVQKKFAKVYAIINNAAQTIARPAEYTAQLRHFEANPLPAVHEKLTKDEATMEWMGFFLTESSVLVGKPLELEHHPTGRAQAAAPSQHRVPDSIDTGDENGSAENHKQQQEAPPPTAAEAKKPSPNDDDDVDVAALREERRQQQEHFPKPRYDRYDLSFESKDKREHNSWTLNMGDVPSGEAAEVMAINALSPFILNSKLKPCLVNREGDTTDEDRMRFIINVSAMEGQFYRFKQTTHPHTNMAKAALNMMTRTSAADYAKDGIYMNAVDTGWITDESPVSKKERREKGENPLCPLDEVDAAARCLDPVFTKSKEHGKFFKDYKETPW